MKKKQKTENTRGYLIAKDKNTTDALNLAWHFCLESIIVFKYAVFMVYSLHLQSTSQKVVIFTKFRFWLFHSQHLKTTFSNIQIFIRILFCNCHFVYIKSFVAFIIPKTYWVWCCIYLLLHGKWKIVCNLMVNSKWNIQLIIQ